MTGPLAGAPPQPEIPADVVTREITAGEWLFAAVVVVVAVLAAVLVRRLTVRAISRRDASEGAALLAGRFLGYTVVVAGVVYALAGLDVRIAPLLGALGIGGIALALALQEILSNLVAGVLLQVRRPFHRGDQIRTGEHEGTVLDVDLRVVTLRAFDGTTVLVPNSQVLSGAIVNTTRRPTRRTTLEVGVAYDTDLRAARQVVLDALAGVESVLAAPAPEVWVERFGESSIDLAVRFWHHSAVASMWEARSEAAVALKSALDEAGVEIPFPQRVVRLPPAAGLGPR